MKKAQIVLFSLMAAAALNFSCDTYNSIADTEQQNTDYRLSSQECLDAYIERCSNDIRLDPNNADLYKYRSDAYFQNGDYLRAIDDINIGISLVPDETVHSFYIFRGAIYIQIMDYDHAVADFNRIILTDSVQDHNLIDAYSWRAFTYRLKGDFELAIDDYRELLILDPNNSRNSYFSIGQIYLYKGDYENAIEYFKRANKHGLDDLSFHYACAYTYNIKGNYDLALENINKIIDVYPNYSYGYAYNLRGEVYKNKGDIIKANTDFAKARELGYK